MPYRDLEEWRWRAEVHLGPELCRGGEGFDAEDVEVVTFSEGCDSRCEFSQADQPDFGGEFQDRVAGMLAEFWRQVGERPRQDPGAVVGTEDGLAEADIPMPGGEQILRGERPGNATT